EQGEGREDTSLPGLATDAAPTVQAPTLRGEEGLSPFLQERGLGERTGNVPRKDTPFPEKRIREGGGGVRSCPLHRRCGERGAGPEIKSRSARRPERPYHPHPPGSRANRSRDRNRASSLPAAGRTARAARRRDGQGLWRLYRYRRVR